MPRFLDFGASAPPEIMTRADASVTAPAELLGLAPVAILDGPRRTGDGRYACGARDPEGNRVGIVAGQMHKEVTR